MVKQSHPEVNNMDDKPQTKLYKTGMSEYSRLDKENGTKANIVQKAYEAAIADLGYSDKELMDSGKSKIVAKLMFSDKYLGNKQFNPLISDDFAEQNDIDKQRTLQNTLDLNLDTFVGNGGLIDRYGGLKRSNITAAVERHYDSQTAQKITSWAWMKAYDPKKSLSENVESYSQMIRQDPILAHTGAKLDSGKFQSIDEAANALATSLSGQSSKEVYQHKHGVDFN